MALTDLGPAPEEQADVIATMQDRLRAMHVTLLFIAVLMCVMLGLNIVLLWGD